ncbi:triacylglycerol lipase [Moniliophthora roreri MCA 2997]|uniref:Carboxylic ester hydrolase n=2 Tax=Moniliophthora roreri TaxID=221103 RepID=V2X9G5_MONRO|nr:triacylglycerol lipase [Moniliophthora roreri MCA 2997]KAI3608131.1 triacylglycerol lipase [Moniliophthora roreri]
MRLQFRLALVGATLLLDAHGFPNVSPQLPVVNLDYGTFSGKLDTTSGITSYLGVQYADPPIGDLRWRAAVSPPSKSLGSVDATNYRDSCIPISATQLNVPAGTSEDCLYGNIYVPANATSQSKLPVLVWFHGGGFQQGNSHDAQPGLLFQSSGPDNQFILASFEYRLGQFGFLAGSAVKNDGQLNAGLMDQRTALRWVKRYIEQFGGDPDRVTIWGQSAGAGSTMFHLIGNNGDDEGLFHAAMGDSPSLSYLPAWNSEYLETIFDQVVFYAGCDSTSGSKADKLTCLRSVDASVLVLAGAKTLQTRGSTLFAFAPCMDGVFINDRPVEAFTQTGRFARVPVLFGSNTNEGANWSNSLPNPSANTSMPNATLDTVYHFIQGQYASFNQDSFGRGEQLYTEFNSTMSMLGQQMYGEARYICSAELITRVVAGVGLGAFQYRYNNPHLGSNHGGEIQAMWGTSTSATDQDRALFEQMREYWTSFVTGGRRPLSKEGVVWEANDGTTSRRVLLDPSGVRMEDITSAQAERCAFWHGISREIDT